MPPPRLPPRGKDGVLRDSQAGKNEPSEGGGEAPEGAEWYQDSGGDWHSILGGCGAPHWSMPQAVGSPPLAALPQEAAKEMVKLLRGSRNKCRLLTEIEDEFCAQASTILETARRDPSRFWTGADADGFAIIGAYPSERRRRSRSRPFQSRASNASGGQPTTEHCYRA